MRVNSTQSLILTASPDRPSPRVGAASAAQREGSTALGAEPLDVSWTEVDVSDMATETGATSRFPIYQSSAGSASRSSGAWTPALQYEQHAGYDTVAKGVYLDVHA
jgi:hypothetical protein